MWIHNRLKSVPGVFSSTWARRMLAILLAVSVVIWYIGPSIFDMGRRAWNKPDLLSTCLNDKLTPWLHAAQELDAVVTQGNVKAAQLPFVGNGKIGFVPGEGLFIATPDRDNPQYSSLTLKVPYDPSIQVAIETLTTRKESSVLDYKHGVFHKYTCYKKSETDSLLMELKVASHRTKPSLLVQELRVENPTTTPLLVSVKQSSSVSSNSLSLQTLTVMFDEKNPPKEYILLRGTITTVDSRVIMFAMATPKVSEVLNVDEKSAFTFTFVTAVHYSEPAPHVEQDKLERVTELAKNDIKEYFLAGPENSNLLVQHKSAWSKVWASGLHVDPRKVLHIPHPSIVNSSMYYVLSSVQAPLHLDGIDLAKRKQLEQLLWKQENCFSGHPTTHANNLWPSVKQEADIAELSHLWQLTLSKRGCAPLVAAGADGMLEAMILSFGGLQITRDHLAFNGDPDILRSNIAFRDIRYNNSHINLTILMEEDGQATMHVSVDSPSNAVLYACEAGCLSEPVSLTSTITEFSVKVTKPLTSLLYIAPSRRHLLDIKRTIHVKEVITHLDHLENLSGPKTGLPPVFWVSIAFLIGLFHLFLIKLIYNEVCGAGAARTSTKYSA
ncbi:PREDICTED: uncharacterized protein KIAA2013 homolog [Branchiostoma belcheri]|uniref:Uncharacterized protein KIAA2013 homolog n=1 Tax=Branchiostoma belcheri TaxID=7741 RepID=A0A6P4Y8H1_BRABE|nr:PREDICTED: uncharacterized protein KIAA2013 homolog [Branchiostoma belcheri]